MIWKAQRTLLIVGEGADEMAFLTHLTSSPRLPEGDSKSCSLLVVRVLSLPPILRQQ